MYRRDVPEIVEYVKKEGPSGVLAVGSFVLSSIQTPLTRTMEQVKEIKKHKHEASALWGHKREAYISIRDKAEGIFQGFIEETMLLEDGLDCLTEIKGLGLPKASFLMQCLGYNTACLDIHNLRYLGVSDNITKIGKVSQQTKERKIKDYVRVVQQDGSEVWWNRWCSGVAGNKMNRGLKTPDAVSRYHYKVISI